MTELRDKIAIAAMQGMIQFLGWDPEARLHGKEEKNKDVLTKSAYAYADAMLEERAKVPQGYYNDPRQNILIEDLVLPVHACNNLLGHGIKRVGDLIKLTKPELRAKRNIGRVTVREIEDVLKCKGLCLRDR